MSRLGHTVKSILQRAVDGDQGPAGLVYGAIDRHGSVLALEAAGVSALGSSMETDALFPLFSMNKPLIATCVLHLVDQGGIGLDDPVESVLPEINAIHVLHEDLTLKPPKIKITLRMLLTHTSGFAYTIFNQKLNSLGRPHEFDARWDRWTQPLVHEPGTSWEYSIGLDWASRVVERVSGLPLWDYAAEHIFHPLGIHDLAFRIQEHTKDKLVGLHQRAPDGTIRLRGHLPGPLYSLENLGKGTLGAFGTVPDYLKFLVPFLNEGVGANGHRILSTEMTRESLRDQLIDLGLHLPDTMRAANSEFTNDVLLGDGSRRTWCLIGMLDRDASPTGRRAGSVWWAGLGNLYWTLDSESGVATVLMNQTLPFWDERVVRAWRELEAAVYTELANESAKI
ncbi:beta-lactamase/transpeptidase-like protein [Exidia glandulosa HHB12029]|uniref:Beta-lactamase/transpeptidase-like protein n=1 Tax=Exidia glandulosa HHB12029 TaxID=1314781 RepID=A0A165KU68_EXIGL|nr:beta-lactamase/transpeptidase-like protein [Exidia glandulosa HHB12029]